VTYFAPTDLASALDFLSAGERGVVAGCTDYFPSLKAGEGSKALLDVSRIDGFRGISQADAGWRIGAATTWTDIVQADLPPAFDGLKLAAREVGSVQIQIRGTIAGNICNASPAADGVPPLLALNAQVEIASTTRTYQVPLSEFITGVRQTRLGSGELVSAILVPEVPDAMTSGFLKLGSRTHLVISIVMAAACLDVVEGQIKEARVAVGSCSPVAKRLPALERGLVGLTAADVQTLDMQGLGALAVLTPISDVRGSDTYRLDVAEELCRRVILQAVG
jgi:CO/xanthine dehydrogenase FAD-binding subunit